MSPPDDADTDRLLAEAVLDGRGSESTSPLAEAEPEIVAQLHAVRTIVEAFDSLGVGPAASAAIAHGPTIADRVRREGPLPPAAAVQVARALCRLLAEKSGRDVRPNTVVENAKGTIELLDGESPAVTPLSTAPEVVCGERPSPRSDVYGVGVVLFYALAGTYPVHERDAAGLRQRHHADRGLGERRFADALRELRGDVSPALAGCVAKALAPARRRYRDVLALEQALARGGEIGDDAPRYRWWPLVAGAMVVAVALALLGLQRDAVTVPVRRATAAEVFVVETPLDARGVPLPAEARELAPLGNQGGFSLSPDGRRLVLWDPARRVAAVRDLTTGQESSFSRRPSSRVLIDSTGRLLYATVDEGRAVIESAGLDGADRQRVCADCGEPLDASADGHFILLQYDHVGHGSLGVIDRSTDRRAEILASGAWSLSHARLSPDGRWMTWHGVSGGGATREFVARFRGVAVVPESDWIPITDGRSTSGAPAWSTDGRRILYLSERDGHRCLWAQSLDSETRQPAGEPVALYHQHARRRALESVDWARADFALARDRMVFTVGEAP